DSAAHREAYATFDALPDAMPAAGAAKTEAKSAKDSAAAAPQIVLMPAISDVGGPDPRPYTYDLKPEEEAAYRSQMLDLAEVQLHPQASAGTGTHTAAKKKSGSGKAAAKSAPPPPFDDVNLRIFDLSSSN